MSETKLVQIVPRTTVGGLSIHIHIYVINIVGRTFRPYKDKLKFAVLQEKFTISTNKM